MPSIVACPTPHEHCSGGKMATNQSLQSASIRFHQTHRDAYNCYRRYLIRVRECEDMGNREFRCPDSEWRIFLTKKSRFGERVRLGKEGSRWMPRSGRGLVVKS